MSASRIEWTGRSDWNPVRGCTRASEGCRHCYAEQIAGRFSGEGQPFHGFATRRGGEGRWTGRVELVEERLTLPLRWRKPATVFASSTSDIFHESLPDAAIDRIFAVMALAPQHTFQVLTKRSARMRSYLTRLDQEPVADTVRRLVAAWPGRAPTPPEITFPLPNVWLGVSVEDQAAAGARVPDLLATPAALRFLSCEPLLGPVDLTCITIGDREMDALTPYHWEDEVDSYASCGVEDWREDFEDEYGRSPDGLIGPMHPTVDWVIAGGESGRGARPMHPDWARSLRDQCAAAGVPFFFKQWGEWAPGEIAGEYLNPNQAAKGMSFFDGAWDEEWSEVDGHCDDEPDVYRIGKARAGRLLDGVEHSGMPVFAA